MEWCDHVAPQRALQGLVSQIAQRRVRFTVLIDGVVQQHVDAPEMREHRIERRIEGGDVHQVHRMREHFCTGIAHCGSGRGEATRHRCAVRAAKLVTESLSLASGSRRDRDAPPLAGERHGGGGADSAAGAGDEDDRVLGTHCSSL